ncbi:unnamed protein product [Urochloa humidicola]
MGVSREPGSGDAARARGVNRKELRLHEQSRPEEIGLPHPFAPSTPLSVSPQLPVALLAILSSLSPSVDFSTLPIRTGQEDWI